MVEIQRVWTLILSNNDQMEYSLGLKTKATKVISNGKGHWLAHCSDPVVILVKVYESAMSILFRVDSYQIFLTFESRDHLINPIQENQVSSFESIF